MAAPHNIFSDTVLGGAFSFLNRPSDTASPTGLLGVPTVTAPATTPVGIVTPAALRSLLGWTPNPNYLVMFDAGGALIAAPVERQGTTPNWVLRFEGTVKIRDSLIFETMSGPGVVPANLRVMVADGLTTRFLDPPVPTAGQEYYLRMTTGGLGWAGQAPGGGGTTGVSGSGTPDRAAKWIASAPAAAIGDSILKLTTNTVEPLGFFHVRPTGAAGDPSAFSIFTNAGAPTIPVIAIPDTALKDYTSEVVNANAQAMFWSETTVIRKASSSRTRDWLSVYSKAETDSTLGNYLPLSAGSGKALTGGLYQIPTSGTPILVQRDGSGPAIGYANAGGNFVLFQADRNTWANIRNGLEYYSGNGDFYVWQFTGSWIRLAVATQYWTGLNYSPLGHTHPYVSSVGLSGPTNDVDIAGSPVTDSGVLDWQWKAKTWNYFLAGPVDNSLGPRQPTFRTIVKNDIPDGALGTGSSISSKFLRGDRTWQDVDTGIGEPSAVGVYGRSIGFWEKISGSSGVLPKWLNVSGAMTMVDSLISEVNTTTEKSVTAAAVVNAASFNATTNVIAGQYLVGRTIVGGSVDTVDATHPALGDYIGFTQDRTKQVFIARMPDDANPSKFWVLNGDTTNKFKYVESWLEAVPQPLSKPTNSAWVLVWNGTAWSFRQLVGTGTMVLTVT